jgi:hypothetical protein
MKVTRVAIAAGSTPTNIPATIPAKFMKVVEDAAVPSETLGVIFKQSDGTFADEVIFQPGVIIRVQGYSGIIGKPPGYVAYQTPVTGDTCLKIRTLSGTGCTVKVTEYENYPLGED